MAGWPVEDIAIQSGYSKVRVSQILGDPKAKLVIAESVERLRRRMVEEVEGEIIDLSKEALKRIGETIRHEDFLLGEDAKKHQDTLSLNFLRGAGILNGMEAGAKEQGRQSPIDPALSVRLVKALEESNKADRLREEAIAAIEEAVVEPDEEEVEVQESEFELVTT
jgi:hypothetical protein